MFDTEDENFSQVVADPAEHSVGAAPGSPGPEHAAAPRLADLLGSSSGAVIRTSMPATATASGRASVMTRHAGGVGTNS
jgi:hypothetical protein